MDKNINTISDVKLDIYSAKTDQLLKNIGYKFLDVKIPKADLDMQTYGSKHTEVMV